MNKLQNLEKNIKQNLKNRKIQIKNLMQLNNKNREFINNKQERNKSKCQ